MTRAKEKALEIFPVKKVPYYGLTCNAYSEKDANLDKRTLFCMGYEQAEKDIIERAVAWLKENANKYIVDIGVGYGENGRNVELIVGGKCWEDLKKAMEEQG